MNKIVQFEVREKFLRWLYNSKFALENFFKNISIKQTKLDDRAMFETNSTTTNVSW